MARETFASNVTKPLWWGASGDNSFKNACEGKTVFWRAVTYCKKKKVNCS